MEGLGRLFNLVPTADAVEVNMKDASAVTFLCVGGNAETFTLAEATTAAGGSAQTLATITRYYSGAAADGSVAWVKETISAGGVVTTTTAKPVAVIHVSASELSDGFDYLRVSSSSTGTVVAILHDLTVQRAPQNLPAAAV